VVTAPLRCHGCRKHLNLFCPNQDCYRRLPPMVKSGAATSRCTSSSPTSKGKILSRGRSPGTCEQQQPGAAVRIKERRSKRRQKRVAGFSPAVHHDSRVCNRFTNKAATLPPRRPGNCVVRQHWLQTEDRELLLPPRISELCLRGGSCQPRNVGISFFR